MNKLKSVPILLLLLASTLVANAQSYSESFSWQGLSLRYPSNYIITDKEYDGESYNFSCEIAGSDDIALMQVVMAKNSFFSLLPDEDWIEPLKEGIRGMRGTLNTSVSGVSLGQLQTDLSGRYPRVSQTFNGHILGIPVYGNMIAFGHGERLVVAILLSDSRTHQKTLLSIVNSIRLD